MPKTGVPAASSPTGFVPGVLRQPLLFEPTTLDPALVPDLMTLDVLKQIYEGLTGTDENNNIVPLLADAMPDISPDGTVYTFHLRKNARFSNGLPVTAQDVKYSMTRMLSPALASSMAMLDLDDVVGAKELNTGKAKELVGVTVVNNRTVRIRLIGPRPYFTGKMTHVPIVCRAVVEKGPRNPAGAHLIWTTNSVGTGPFVLREYQPRQKITLTANPNYWGGKPNLQRIERPIVKEGKTARNLYDTGQLDIVPISPADYSEAMQNPAMKGHLRLTNRNQVTFLQISQKQYAPFRDRRVRQALALAIDRVALTRAVLEGTGMPATGLLPPGMPGYSPSFKGLGHDVERAKKLLAEAGYTTEKPLPPFTLLYWEKVPAISRMARLLREQWEAVGFQVNLKDMEGVTGLKMDQGEFDVSIDGWASPYADPHAALAVLLLSDSPGNYVRYNSPEFDRLCRAADTGRDPATRYALYQKAMQVAMEDAQMVPLFFTRDVELVSPHVHGLRECLFGRLPHTGTTVE